MFEYTGQIVRADAGRDKGGIFCVVGVDREGVRLLLADGKRRRIARPKAKKQIPHYRVTMGLNVALHGLADVSHPAALAGLGDPLPKALLGHPNQLLGL